MQITVTKIIGMKYLMLLISIITVNLIQSCGNSSNSDLIYKPDQNELKQLDSINNLQTSDPLIQNPNNLSAPAINSSQPIQTTTTIEPVTTGTGLNPEHGKPGHRCDIAVGAPLNSTVQQPAANTTTAINQTSPQIITTQPVAGKPVAAGMNPEHGKPGHRCDIAVGAPLNSPVQQPNTAVTNTPSISSTNSPLITPKLPAASGTPFAPGMNPEHGKPGHRCDIAVGAPLDSKPAEVKTEQAKIEEKVVTPKKDSSQ